MDATSCACGHQAECRAPFVTNGVPASVRPSVTNASLTHWSSASHDIPTIVHQTWKTCGGIPELQASWREGCMTLNPGWKWMLWSDADNRRLIADHYPWFLSVYDGYMERGFSISRVDAARLFILHRFGGVYMDMDFACLNPLSLLPQPRGHAVFSFQYPDTIKDGRPGAVANNFMAVPAGHPFIAFAISKLTGAAHMPTVLQVAGPEFLTLQLRNYYNAFSRDSQGHRQKSTDYKVRNSTAVTIYSQPLVYGNTWDRPLAKSCGLGTPADLDICRAHPGKNRSVLTTFWTNSWKGSGSSFNLSSYHLAQLRGKRSVGA